MKRWNQVLEEWENGNHPKLPTNVKNHSYGALV